MRDKITFEHIVENYSYIFIVKIQNGTKKKSWVQHAPLLLCSIRGSARTFPQTTQHWGKAETLDCSYTHRIMK